MRVSVIAAILILCTPSFTSAQARDAVTTPRTGSGAIAGLVLVDEPGTPPARRARVTLNTPDRREPGMTATTDDTGAFAFVGVPAGRYLIQASKAGYLTTDFGAKRAERPGTPVVLKDDERLSGLTLRLTRGGVISGTIFDQNGRPLPEAAVTVLKFSWSAFGERTLGQFNRGGSGVTDDRGMYRAWGLLPGEYVVRATIQLTSAPPGALNVAADFRPISSDEMRRVLSSAGRAGGAGSRDASDAPTMPSARPVTYAPVYFPGAADLDAATTITLGPGEERSGLDFHVQPVPTATISGTVTGPAGTPALPILVTLQPGGKSGLLLGGTGGRGGPSTRVAADGSFALSGIAPGQYTLIARPPPIARGVPGAGPAGPSAASLSTMWAQTDITIDGRDASVALDLQPGMTISGRLVFEGSAPPPTNVTAYQVRLIPPGSGGNLGAGPAGGEVTADGRFMFTGVMPGEYRVVYSGSPPGWGLKTSIANGRDAYDMGLRVVAGENVEWTMTYTDKPTRLEGVLLDTAGAPAPDFFIVAFPTNRSQWLPGSRRIATPRPANDGKYSTSLPSGEYYVAALTDLEPGEWNNAAFLEQLVGSAIRVTLTDGQVTRQDLKIR